VLALFPSSPISRALSGFFYLPDFSALWGYFFSIARKKWRFGPLRSRRRAAEQRLGVTTERRRSQLFACVRRPSRYDEREIHDGRRSAAREAARRFPRLRHEEERMRFAPVTKAAGTAGNAEGSTPLNAFDNALLVAGIGNINLIKVSSILPPGVELVPLPRIKPGALVPTAYAAMTSEVPGEVVAAAVGWARPQDPAKNGVIMEYHDKATREEAERMIVQMLEEAFRVRGETIRDMRVFAVEHRVERTGCALAAVTLLSDEDLG
jgi:arginine decarboxylase